MIPGATPSRIFRYTDDLTELVRSKTVIGNGKVTASKGILRTESKAIEGDRAWCYLSVYAPGGSVVEVSCKARQVTSTSQGRIAIDQYADNSTLGGGSVDWVQPDTTYWKPYKLTYAGSHKKPFMLITFGIWLSLIGTTEFKDIVITVYNVEAPSPVMRFCLVQCNNGVWSIDDSNTRFTNVGCQSVSVVDNEYLDLKWAPMPVWQRPITFAQIDGWDAKTDFDVKVNRSDKGSVRLYLVKPSTGALLNPKSITGSMWIHVLAIGI